jgi:hypothetical protein
MRRLDTPGDIEDQNIRTAQPSEAAGNLLIEIPLWRYGRVKFESASQKASLALVVLCLVVICMIILALLDCLPGNHPAVASFSDKLGYVLTLVIGVLFGVEWKTGRE